MEENLKQLLLVDLSARIPYGVIAKIPVASYVKNIPSTTINDVITGIDAHDKTFNYGSEYAFCKEDRLFDRIGKLRIKPYLRPLASMTEEERDRLRSLDGFIRIDIQNGIVEGSYDVFDYLNSIHVSYRTINGKDMFELELALVAPEGMYNIKK